VKPKALPLGIDLGSARIRVAACTLESDGPTIQRVVSHQLGSSDRPDEVLRNLIREAEAATRRCVIALHSPDATLRLIDFPHMSAHERERAARFETRRNLGQDDAVVRCSPRAVGKRFMVGAVARAHLRAKTEIADRAGLQVVAVDHEALALRRVLETDSAILDIGLTGSRLYAFGPDAFAAIALEYGGASFTEAIERSLNVPRPEAEKRKVATGFAGAAAAELGSFSSAVGRALLELKAQGFAPVERIVLTGNGARVPGLSLRLEQDTGCVAGLVAALPLTAGPYPIDVVRVNSCDWSAAVGLALWELSA
jgi:Tfp pilus assembly PilM family ATPase